MSKYTLVISIDQMSVLLTQSLSAGCHGEFGSLFKTKTQTPKPKLLTNFMHNIPRMDFITSKFKFSERPTQAY